MTSKSSEDSGLPPAILWQFEFQGTYPNSRRLALGVITDNVKVLIVVNQEKLCARTKVACSFGIGKRRSLLVLDVGRLTQQQREQYHDQERACKDADDAAKIQYLRREVKRLRNIIRAGFSQILARVAGR